MDVDYPNPQLEVFGEGLRSAAILIKMSDRIGTQICTKNKVPNNTVTNY